MPYQGYEVIDRNSAVIEKRVGEKLNVKYILDLRDFPGDPNEKKVVHDINVILDDPEVEIVCETMGGNEPAFTYSKNALLKGITQLMVEVHFTSAIWTEPIATSRKEPYLNQLCKATTTFGEGLLCEVLKETEKRIGRIKNEDGIVVIDLDLLAYDGQRHHLRDWNRDYVKNLLNEL